MKQYLSATHRSTSLSSRLCVKARESQWAKITPPSGVVKALDRPFVVMSRSCFAECDPQLGGFKVASISRYNRVKIPIKPDMPVPYTLCVCYTIYCINEVYCCVLLLFSL